jgi:hypothetical protein
MMARTGVVGIIAGCIASAVWVMHAVLSQSSQQSPSVSTKRILFKSHGAVSSGAQPVEGYDPATPTDAECLRHGDQYRVHLPALLGAMCAVFYEDDLSEGERPLADLVIHSVVRFTVTPDPGDSAAVASAVVAIGGRSSPAGGRRRAQPPIESRTPCPAHAQGRSMGGPHGGDARPAAGKEVMPIRPL